MLNIDYFKNWLKDFDLDKDKFAVFGSGPLYLRGIIDKITDIDLIVRTQNWYEVSNIGRLNMVNWIENIVISDTLEIWKQRRPWDWDIDKLIDTADVFDGIRFVSLGNVLKWKMLYNRDKDKIHIKLIQKYLNKGNN